MKRLIPYWILSVATALIFSAGLLAQEQVEVSVKVKKDGKVVTDTTYTFEDADEAKRALNMMNVMTGDDEHMEHVTYNYTSAHTGSGHSKAMVFISEDGKKTEITKIQGDSLVWVTEEEGNGDHVKVMKYQIEEGEEPQGKHVIVMKSEDGKTFDILVDEHVEGDDVVKTKKVNVVVSGDEKGNWTVVEGDEKLMDEDENVFIMEGDEEVKVKIMKIMEEEDGEHVKVIVISGNGEEGHDHGEDSDHVEDIDVKVVKKRVKKENK